MATHGKPLRTGDLSTANQATYTSRLFHSSLLLLAALVLAGCGTPGFPRQSYNEKKQIQQLEKEFEKPDLITKYYALSNAPEADKRAARDRLIGGRLALMNLNYNQFIARFSVTKQSLDFGTEITELGLNLATTAVGGASTKTVLAAISSGVTGSKLAIDKNFFFEKTVPVLITTMNAQRKVALAPLLIGMTNTTEVYPLAQALSDLDTYYLAGTFIGALQAIQADAGAKDKVAETNITFIRTQDFRIKGAHARLNAIMEKIDKLSRTDAIKLENNLPVPADKKIDDLVKLRDSNSLRLKDTDADNPEGKITKQLLKMRVVMSQSSEEALAAWEAAVKTAD